MIHVVQLLPVNERLEPRGGEFPFSLFAAEDAGTGTEPALVPVEEFSGVPEAYLLRVENPDPTQERYYGFQFSDALGHIVDIEPQDGPDLAFDSDALGDRAAAIPLGDLDGDGLAEFIALVRDSNGPDAVLERSRAEIRGAGEVLTKLLLPAPILTPSVSGAHAVVSTPGDWNGDGLSDIAVAISRVADPAVGAQPLADEGVYLIFGRESWATEVDLLEDADVVINNFGAGIPLSVASAGNVNDDRFDDLLVSVGGEQPRVELFRGDELWVEPIDVLGSWLSDDPPGWLSDGELLFDGTGAAFLPTLLLEGQTDLTFEFWYSSRDPDSSTVLSVGGAAGISLSLEDGGTSLAWSEGTESVKFQLFDNGDSIADGAPHHLALVRDADTTDSGIELYVDGKLVAAQDVDALDALEIDAEEILLGDHASQTAPLRGTLYELRVWETVRTADEIEASYTTALTGEQPDLRGYYRFAEGGGQLLVDATSNDGFHGLLGHPDRLLDVFAVETSAGNWNQTDQRSGEDGHSFPLSLRFAPDGSDGEDPWGSLDTGPVIDLAGAAQANLSFTYLLDAAGRCATDAARVVLTGLPDVPDGELVLASSRPDEAPYRLNDMGDVWQTGELSLREYLGLSGLGLRFEYTGRVPAEVGEFEWFLDDVRVESTSNPAARDVITLDTPGRAQILRQRARTPR